MTSLQQRPTGDRRLMSLGWIAMIAVTALLPTCGYDGPKLDAAALKAKMETGEKLLLLDVRPRSQFDKAHIEGARNIPLEQLTPLQNEVVQDGRETAVICSCGRRSLEAVRLLTQAGGRPILVEGGMTAWQESGYPTVSSR